MKSTINSNSDNAYHVGHGQEVVIDLSSSKNQDSLMINVDYITDGCVVMSKSDDEKFILLCHIDDKSNYDIANLEKEFNTKFSKVSIIARKDFDQNHLHDNVKKRLEKEKRNVESISLNEFDCISVNHKLEINDDRRLFPRKISHFDLSHNDIKEELNFAQSNPSARNLVIIHLLNFYYSKQQYSHNLYRITAPGLITRNPLPPAMLESMAKTESQYHKDSVYFKNHFKNEWSYEEEIWNNNSYHNPEKKTRNYYIKFLNHKEIFLGEKEREIYEEIYRKDLVAIEEEMIKYICDMKEISAKEKEIEKLKTEMQLKSKEMESLNRKMELCQLVENKKDITELFPEFPILQSELEKLRKKIENLEKEYDDKLKKSLPSYYNNKIESEKIEKIMDEKNLDYLKFPVLSESSEKWARMNYFNDMINCYGDTILTEDNKKEFKEYLDKYNLVPRAVKDNFGQNYIQYDRVISYINPYKNNEYSDRQSYEPSNKLSSIENSLERGGIISGKNCLPQTAIVANILLGRIYLNLGHHFEDLQRFLKNIIDVLGMNVPEDLKQQGKYDDIFKAIFINTDIKSGSIGDLKHIKELFKRQFGQKIEEQKQEHKESQYPKKNSPNANINQFGLVNFNNNNETELQP